MADDPLNNVPPEHVFHFRDGKQAHNLKDLRDAIIGMPDDEFAHHVDDTNNDFANWVEFVYKKPELAADLRAVTDPGKVIDVLDAELGKYTGEDVLDEAVEETSAPAAKQPHEDPAKLSDPPQTMVTHDNKVVYDVSTEAPHKFIIKEFFWGMLLGLLVGIILFAALLYFDAFPAGVC
ncbi:hypothetical protein GF367_03965 [Candidatus Woesearchaeota archaeon]|nr:hypothetical protein [Candidatus Woesearchaeota archaeon]